MISNEVKQAIEDFNQILIDDEQKEYMRDLDRIFLKVDEYISGLKGGEGFLEGLSTRKVASGVSERALYFWALYLAMREAYTAGWRASIHKSINLLVREAV